MKTFEKEEIDKFIEFLDFSKIEGNLIPVITQDFKTSEILMFAFANENAVKKSLATGYAHYYSRSRKKLWKKGEESGHIQEIQHVLIDCDADTLLFKVKQKMGACHTGYFSCFHKEYVNGEFIILSNRIFDPDDVYKK